MKYIPSMRTLVSATLAFLLLASGSARAQGVVMPLPAQDQQNITAQLGPGVVGAALPSSPITDPSVYFPLQQKSQQFQVVAGPNAGTVQTLGLWQARRPGGRGDPCTQCEEQSRAQCATLLSGAMARWRA